jgi:hypothetical protein
VIAPQLERDGRARNLRPALAFLRLPPTEPELRLLHRTFDNWHGLGLVTVGVERQDMRLSLSHIAEGEWRATFMENEKWAPRGFGVAPTPWGARCSGRRGRRWARRDDESIAGCLLAAPPRRAARRNAGERVTLTLTASTSAPSTTRPGPSHGSWVGPASVPRSAAYFFSRGSKLNFWPPTLASAIRPPLPIVKIATPSWYLTFFDASAEAATALA